MKKVDINFSIKGMDSNLDFKVKGEFKNKRLKFVDPEENTNYIILKDDLIEYYKKGNIFMKYLFNTNKETKGIYQIMGNEFQFRIVTKEIIKKPTRIHIKFDLYQDKDLINKNILDVEFQEE